MMAELMWKEWREQRWRLAFACVLLIGFTAIGLHSRMSHDEEVLAFALFIGGVFLPLLVAVGMIGTDREEGTLPFTMALPAEPRRILAAKTVVAAATVLLPLVAVLVLALLMAANRQMPSAVMFKLWVTFSWIGINVLIWTVGFAATQPTEGRVGGVGIVVLTLWLAQVTFMDAVCRNSFARVFFAAPNPGSTVWTFLAGESLLIPVGDLWFLIVFQLVAQTAIMAGLWLWTARRLSAGRRMHS